MMQSLIGVAAILGWLSFMTACLLAMRALR